MGGSCSKNKKQNQRMDQLGGSNSFVDYDMYDYIPGTSGLGASGFGANPKLGGSGFGANSKIGGSGFGAIPSGFGSKNGYGGGANYGAASSCPEGVGQNTALLATAAAIAVGAATLYRAITLQTAGRRRRRSVESQDKGGILEYISDKVWMGLEEFEEKMDKLGEGVEDEEDQESWITKLYNDFKHVKDEVDAEEKLSENDLDGLEPPILDATWGLGAVRNNFEGEKSSKTADISSNEIDSSRGKRSVEDEFVKDVDNEVDIADSVEGGEKCRLLVWRCMSRVMEGGLGYIEKPGGLMGLAQKTLFKIAFHGGFSNIWKSIMTIPEARSVKRCMNEHDECISYEILAAEASTGHDDDDKDIIREKKKKRMIINSEFVAGLDTSDGANQYDDDVLIDEDM